MVDEQNMKAKTKGHNEYEKYQGKLWCCIENVNEHEDVDSKEWDVLKVGEEVQPWSCDQKWSRRPLPTLKFLEFKIL